MVAKRRASAYAGALTDDWLKVKCLRIHDLILSSLTAGGPGQPGGLLVGELVDGKLRYLGRVESGIGRHERKELLALMKARSTSPFADEIPEVAPPFCEPTIRLPIEFVDFGDDGLLRRPSLCRFAQF